VKTLLPSFIWYSKAIECVKKKQWKDAISAFNQAIITASSRSESTLIYCRRGLVFEKMHKYSAVKECWIQARECMRENEKQSVAQVGHSLLSFLEQELEREENTNDVDLWCILGIAHIKLSHFKPALAFFEKALALEERHSISLYYMAYVFGILGRYNEAIKCYQILKEGGNIHVLALYRMAFVFYNMNKLEKAKETLEEMLKMGTDEGEKDKELRLILSRGWNLQGSILMRLDCLKEALASFVESIRLQEDYKVPWCNRGKVLLKLGEKRRALPCFLKAVSLDPQFWTCWQSIALLLVEMGKLLGALKAFDRILGHQYTKEMAKVRLRVLHEFREEMGAKKRNLLGLLKASRKIFLVLRKAAIPSEIRFLLVFQSSDSNISQEGFKAILFGMDAGGLGETVDKFWEMVGLFPEISYLRENGE